MISPDIHGTPATAPPVAPTAAAHDRGISFRDVLSGLNPLQYLPIIGSIYRAETGDVIPEALRRIGSLLFSGLLGGPIGLAINIGSTIAEKVTGLDPDEIVADQLKVIHATTAPAPDTPRPGAVPVNTARVGLTPDQLAAYGVRSDTTGTLRTRDIQGADVLNTIELARLSKIAAAAYGLKQPVLLTADQGA